MVLVLRYYRFAEAPPLADVAQARPARAIQAAAEPPQPTSAPESLDAYVREASRTYAVPAALIHAVIHVESAGNARAVSPKGAQGLMQLMPQTAAALGVRDPFDPRDNVLAGTRYLRFLLNAFDGDVPLSLAAYNAGHDVVVRYRGVPPYSETRRYLSRVAWQFDLELEASP
jgi:soluble lytic murein transglycosylase-like protein